MSFLGSMESGASLLVFRSRSYLDLHEKRDLPLFSAYLLQRTLPFVRSPYPPASTLLSNAPRQYRNLNLLSIAYASRPGLRSRLTLRGRAFLRNPWAFDGGDSHSPFRYSCQHSHLYDVHLSLQSGFFLHTTLLYHLSIHSFGI